MSLITTDQHLADVVKHKSLRVTAQPLDSLSVSWLDVEKEKIEDNTSKIPALNLLYNVDHKLDQRQLEILQLQSRTDVLEGDVTYISNVVDLHQLSIDQHQLSLDNLSGLADLSKCKVARFKGVSSTDPKSGIVTVNGVQYIVSCDLSGDEHNGDVYYHHQKVGLGSDAKEVLFAYIYSNGLFNKHDVDSLNGEFYKIGYGFYDNISTEIYDDMVADYAAIKRSKIDGLEDILGNTSSDIEFLSARLCADELSIGDYITYLSDSIDGLSSIVETEYATKVEVNDISNIITADLEQCINFDDIQEISESSGEVKQYRDLAPSHRKVPSTQTLSVLFESYSKHHHMSSDIDDMKDLLNDFKLSTLDPEYDRMYVNSCIEGDDAHLSVTNVAANISAEHSEQYVPNMRVISELLNYIKTVSEPQIGTLRFVASPKALAVDRNKNIHQPTFDGWVYPNGEILTVGENEFVEAKKELMGGDGHGTTLQLPKLEDFIKLNPGTHDIDTSMTDTWNFTEFNNGLKEHTHNISNFSTTESTLQVKLGFQVGTGGGSTTCVHVDKWGNPRQQEVASTLTIPSVNVSGTIQNSSSSEDVETKPKHNTIPVLMYIGHR